jgi:UDP-3-O-[3-hydroxymyristoyl] glucosamine N-acyltransferase
VNLGAGTKLSNLEFRTLQQKKDLQFPIIKFKDGEGAPDIKISKAGAIIGDGCETGCNAVLSPAVILGKECWIFPNKSVKKGIYPAKSFIK